MISFLRQLHVIITHMGNKVQHQLELHFFNNSFGSVFLLRWLKFIDWGFHEHTQEGKKGSAVYHRAGSFPNFSFPPPRAHNEIAPYAQAIRALFSGLTVWQNECRFFQDIPRHTACPMQDLHSRPFLPLEGRLTFVFNCIKPQHAPPFDGCFDRLPFLRMVFSQSGSNSLIRASMEMHKKGRRALLCTIVQVVFRVPPFPRQGLTYIVSQIPSLTYQVPTNVSQ